MTYICLNRLFRSFPKSMHREETVPYYLKAFDDTYKIYTNLLGRARRLFSAIIQSSRTTESFATMIFLSACKHFLSSHMRKHCIRAISSCKMGLVNLKSTLMDQQQYNESSKLYLSFIRETEQLLQGHL